MSSHNKRKTIEARLEAFLSLKSTGLDNSYINDNIKYNANRYHELTGDWYRRVFNTNKSIIEKPLSSQEVEYWDRFNSYTLQKTIVGGRE